MKNKTYFKILLWICSLCFFLLLILKLILEPVVEKKIKNALNEKIKNYSINVIKIHFSLIKSEIKLDDITISSKHLLKGKNDSIGKIKSVKIKGIHLLKFILKNDIDISRIDIFTIIFKYKIPVKEATKKAILSAFNIKIDNIFINNINLQVKNPLNSANFSVEKGNLKIYNLDVKKQESISPMVVKKFDLKIKTLTLLTSDSMYTFTANNIFYTTSINKLTINSFSIHSTYKNYDYTSRYKYATDCFNASFSTINIHHFSVLSYFKSKKLLSSFVEIGKMDLIAFRDNRRKERHEIMPEFQEKLYNYPGLIKIDSFGLAKGNITYIEHDEEANKAGNIRFNEINAKVYNITNDSIYLKKKAFFVLKGKALLMGKAKLNLFLKARLFDRHNTFSLKGSLSAMKTSDLNPMLENNAFLYTSGCIIDGLKFNFTANHYNARGKIIFLYHGMDITIKNNKTDDTTAFKEVLISFIANIKVYNSNPLPDKDIRIGIINYKRDPERFLFNYCVKSLLTGVKSSITKNIFKKKKT